jgi:hypothetical protein
MLLKTMLLEGENNVKLEAYPEFIIYNDKRFACSNRLYNISMCRRIFILYILAVI